MPTEAPPVSTAEEVGKEDASAANMSDTNTSDTTAVTSPAQKATKRDNEGNPKEAQAETVVKAPTAAVPKPSPTSEVKKQNAAMSLTQLFTTTQDSLTSCESGTNDTLGEAGNFLAECFSGDGDGEHAHLVVDPNAAPVENAGGESNTPTMGNTENSAAATAGGESPARKKAKGADGIAVKTEEEETADVAAAGKTAETPLAMKAGAYRLNKLMEATKFTSPIPEHPVPKLPDVEGADASEIQVPTEPEKPVTVNRKEKSLGLLCQNFMELCKDAPPCGENDDNGALVELNELANHLKVQRRRIYDIINIMESIHIVSRLKKNTYRWHGTEKLPLYFARLQRDGLAELRSGIQPDKQIKGMSLTCQKLIQYFLTTGLMEIRLTDAAEAVLGPSEEKTFKTKIRRMYDIANVLTSLGIIRKENVAGTSSKAQPSFRWVYPISPHEMALHLPAAEQDGGSTQLIPPQTLHHPPVQDDLAQEMEGSQEVAAAEQSAPEEEAVDSTEAQAPEEQVEAAEESMQEMVSV